MFAYLFHPGSYLGIIVLLVLTGCGMPVPEEVFIVIAGVLSSQGKLEPGLAFAACLTGALLGDAVMYGIGYKFGHTLLLRHPKLSKLIGASREAEFEESISRHGFKVMLMSRFMVGIRGPVYLAAGTVRMPFRKFLLWDFICATLVVGLFFGVSYHYGEAIADSIKSAEWYFTLIVLLVICVVTLYFLRRHRKQMLEAVVEDKAKVEAILEKESPDAESREAS